MAKPEAKGKATLKKNPPKGKTSSAEPKPGTFNPDKKSRYTHRRSSRKKGRENIRIEDASAESAGVALEDNWDVSQLKVPPAEGKQQIPIDQYKRNLDELTKRLKRTGATIIFATTTPVPEGASGRVPGDAKRYNDVALAIMRKHKVSVNDLYTFAISRLDEIQRPHDVHFTQEGSRLLAEQVAQSILVALPKRRT